ncbi:MAG: DNA recombination protein RmuC [Candidatus Caenarcaniphilales bacterium]|jgi:DNA recombination protein RmuC|nr:DNA recombination protein RmuC [Candidatus Caenarcaniphilales bacterium]
MEWLLILVVVLFFGYVIFRDKSQSDKFEIKLKDSFNALAAEALSSNNRLFLDLAEQKFDNLKLDAQKNLEIKEQSFSNLLTPLSKMISDYKSAVESLELENAKSLTSINGSLFALAEQAGKLSLETTKLNNVLGTAKQRGRWGEITVRKILEQAGLNSFTDFTEQNIDQAGTKPDFVIKLPNKRNIVIDSKFNADAYIRAIESNTDEDRNKHLKAHAKNIADTCKDLSKKKYHEADQYAADFVIMFVPNDSVLAAAAEIDPIIVENALNNKVVLATPSTLYAMLKVVALGWQEFELNQNAERVREIGKELFKRARTLVEHLDDLQLGMKRSVKAFNNLVGSFETKLLPQLNKFKEYGVTSEELESTELLLDEIRVVNQQSKYLVDTSDATSQKSVGPADLP